MTSTWVTPSSARPGRCSIAGVERPLRGERPDVQLVDDRVAAARRRRPSRRRTTRRSPGRRRATGRAGPRAASGSTGRAARVAVEHEPVVVAGRRLDARAAHADGPRRPAGARVRGRGAMTSSARGAHVAELDGPVAEWGRAQAALPGKLGIGHGGPRYPGRAHASRAGRRARAATVGGDARAARRLPRGPGARPRRRARTARSRSPRGRRGRCCASTGPGRPSPSAASTPCCPASRRPPTPRATTASRPVLRAPGGHAAAYDAGTRCAWSS